MSKIPPFRSVFEEALQDIADRTVADKRCLILSGGVDTCAILAAAKKLNITFAAGITVTCGESSPDPAFATAAAKEHNLPHHIVSVTPDDLVSNYLPYCVKLLHTFDGMTLRNSLVVAAAFQRASQLGFTDCIVGDGADELLGGYSFMWGNEDDPEQWKEKRDSMCQKWTFATEALATSYNLQSHSPYTEQKVVDWVLHNTTRSDCIGTRPICLVYQGERVDHVAGKMLLREAYETVSSWRRKDPIEVGSGITVIGKDQYWEAKISDAEFKAQTDELKFVGFIIKTKENLVNFRIFQSYFGDNGDEHPTLKRLELGQGCVGCCYEIGDRTFCRICGAYPAQRT